MASYEVELLPAAFSDLDEIFEFILADSPQTANDILESIMHRLRSLESFPLSGAPLLDRSLTKFNFRMIVIDPYIVFYRFINNKVLIYRILHGARDYSHILKQTIR